MQPWKVIGIALMVAVICFDGGRAYESSMEAVHDVAPDALYPQVDFLSARLTKLQPQLQECRQKLVKLGVK